MVAFAIHLIQTTIGSNGAAKQRNIHLEVVENGRKRSICVDLHRMAGRKNIKFGQDLKKWLWKKKKAG